MLWGFGLCYGSEPEGGVFLSRAGFAPIAVAMPRLAALPWLPDQLMPLAHPSPFTQQQLVAALRWIAYYEAWVVDSCGSAYRQACVEAWTRGQLRVPAAQIVGEWERLAARYGDIS